MIKILDFIKKLVYLMLLVYAILFLPELCVAKTQPFTCYIQLNKAQGWENFNVQFNMYDLMTQKTFATFLLPKAEKNKPSNNHLTKAFDCKNHPIVSFTASYNPPIWQSDIGKDFSSNVTWNLQSQILSHSKDAAGITIKINFPENFIEVPSPNLKKDYVANEVKGMPGS